MFEVIGWVSGWMAEGGGQFQLALLPLSSTAHRFFHFFAALYHKNPQNEPFGLGGIGIIID